jgi:hypothetical protein
VITRTTATIATDEAGRNLPAPVQDFLPATFAERGVAVPFTTPVLAGARARPGGRGGLELVVPNPSGGRGVYILPLWDMGSLCRPTVHDTRLAAAIAMVSDVTPAAIRAAARPVAAEGFAGRAAAAAARSAQAAERDAARAAHRELTCHLVRQAEVGVPDMPPLEAETPAAIERRVWRATARLARDLECRAESIAAALAELSVPLGALGIGGAAQTARIPRLIAGLKALQADLRDVAAANEPQGSGAEPISAAIGTVLACVGRLLPGIGTAAADPGRLVREWLFAHRVLVQTLARPDWLLDGWDRVTALWPEACGPFGDGPTLSDMARLVPVLPREAASWAGPGIGVEEANPGFWGRRVPSHEDWRLARTLADAIAWNEALLERAA